jgi:hypothetical protein
LRNKIIALVTGILVALACFSLIISRAAQNPAADLNKDGQVNVFDLSILLSKWGQTGAGDINADGTVTILDLSILLSSWGAVSTYDPTARTFVGDFETGNFSQWDVCQTVVLNSSCANYNGSHYSLQLSSTVKRQGNYAARFELHDGDNPGFSPGTERDEILVDERAGGDEGDEGWYQWSTQFGTPFPLDHATQGWGLVAQWHDQSNGSPPVGWYTDNTDGKWGLAINRQSSPGVFINNPTIWETPLAQGTWQDIKMHIKWSANDTVGFVELWHNGSRVNFTGAPCAGQTRCTIRTLVPGGGGTYFKQGIYRQSAVNGTAVVYHDGFVSATSESGLGAY